MKPMPAYVNGSFVTNPVLPLADGGFLNGATVTDNCRTWNGALFRWADHLERFRRDCDTCHIPLRHSDAEITAIANQLLPAEDVHLVTCATPQSFLMFTRPIDQARNERFLREGVKLNVVGHQATLGSSLLPPRVKHRSRMVWHIAQSLAGDDVAVLLDRPNGTLTETAIACVLAVIDGVLVTPPRELILDSISLRVALELAGRFEERELRQSDWTRASEMLLAGTGFGIAGVRSIDGHTFAFPGPVTAQLQQAWTSCVS